MNALMTQLVMIGGIFGLMYFMVIRPQKKAADKKQAMLKGMKTGDEVITIGGLHGLIDEIDNENKLVVLDCEGIFLTFELSAIASVKETVKSDKITISSKPSAINE